MNVNGKRRSRGEVLEHNIFSQNYCSSLARSMSCVLQTEVTRCQKCKTSVFISASHASIEALHNCSLQKLISVTTWSSYSSMAVS